MVAVAWGVWVVASVRRRVAVVGCAVPRTRPSVRMPGAQYQDCSRPVSRPLAEPAQAAAPDRQLYAVHLRISVRFAPRFGPPS
jgi:hypothetical protein